MANGQLRLLRAREPIATVLQDPSTPADDRERLGLVLEARDFARGIGLDVGEQYTSYAPWPGDRRVTAVVAVRPGSLETEDFWFPIVGRVPYKSYFDRALADGEAQRLRADGLDVCLAVVPAYSTLGWLADPVTGPLLRAPAPDLVATVIHELVHVTVYVPDDADWNEGLATFVGQEGSVRFFEERGGAGSEAARYARARVEDQRAISAGMLALREAASAVKFDDALVAYLLQIVAETREHDGLRLGVSPRGAVALRRAAQARALVEGRDWCIPDDVRDLALDVLSHRVSVASPGGAMGGSEQAEWILREILERIPVPL